MKKIIEIIKKNFAQILQVFLFLCSIALIVFLFPKEGKFRYEFQRGKPWMHETLIAPFDFPIYKSEKQLQVERDSINRSIAPYFLYDSNVIANQLSEFESYYNNKLNDYISFNYQNKENSYSYKQLIKNSEKFYNYGKKTLKDVYEIGILELSEVFSQRDVDEVVILKGKMAKETPVDELLTQKDAYGWVLDRMSTFTEDTLMSVRNSDFYKAVNLYEFIEPNLTYNKETTDNVKNSQLENISLSKGMVQQGERIIAKGDVIDANTYRVLESLRQDFEVKLGSSYYAYMILIGQIIFVLTCMGVMYLFLWNFRNDILQNNLKTSFILFLVLIIVATASISMRFSINSLYIIPFAIVPVIIKTFYDARLALFIHIITVLLVGFFAPNGFEFVFLNFIAGIVAIFTAKDIHRRGRLFLSAAFIILTYSFIYFGISITRESNIKDLEFIYFLYFTINGILVLLSYPLIYLFEKVFGFLSDVTLMELADTNQPLLRKLAEKAPGTFQHSLQVANLAEEIIFKMGGNPLLVRTGALYHDIGKLSKSFYFTENQSTGYNPHEGQEFEESAKIIINHIKEGVEIARRNNLPEPIIDFIRTHQGTTKVNYFLRNYQKKYPDRKIDTELFSYPGPKPFSKETAVLMMADSIEAASRSLDKYDEKGISELVNQIIDGLMEEKQFENVDLTFKDITTIKNIFIQKLLNIYHARIKYPKKPKKD